MENNKYFKQFVDRLDVNQKALDTLKENKITTLGELSKYKKSLKNCFINSLLNDNLRD